MNLKDELIRRKDLVLKTAAKDEEGVFLLVNEFIEFEKIYGKMLEKIMDDLMNTPLKDLKEEYDTIIGKILEQYEKWGKNWIFILKKDTKKLMNPYFPFIVTDPSN